MDFAVIRDAAALSGLFGTWLAWWLTAKKRAVDIAVWRRDRERDGDDLRTRIAGVEDRLNRGDRKLAELAERDDAILKALNELRVAVARLEEKIDRRNGA